MASLEGSVNGEQQGEQGDSLEIQSMASAPYLPPRFIGATDLIALQFEPLKWAVPSLIPAGVTLLCGAPKIGKSWLSMDLARAVAAGDKAFGTIAVEQNAVLYLALEDSLRRLKDRLNKLLNFEPPPAGLYFVAMDGGFPRLHEGGLAWIEAWIKETPNAGLIIIDTLAKVRPPLRAGSIYEQDYAVLQGLLQLANKHGVAVVVVHHTRKGSTEDVVEEISGSFGLSGSVDSMLILKRKRTSTEGQLTVTGRDVVEAEFNLLWDAALTKWTIASDTKEFSVTKEREEILDVLAESDEPMSPQTIAGKLNKKSNSIRFLLHRMREDGQVTHIGRGKYSLHPESDERANIANITNDDSDADDEGMNMDSSIATDATRTTTAQRRRQTYVSDVSDVSEQALLAFSVE